VTRKSPRGLRVHPTRGDGGHGRGLVVCWLGLVICWRTRKRGGRCGRPAVFQSLSNQVNGRLIFLSNSPYLFNGNNKDTVDPQVFERTAGLLQPAVRNMNT